MPFESADGLLGGEQLGIALSLDKPSLVQIGLSINHVYRRPHKRRPIMQTGNLCDGGGYRGFDLPLFGEPTVVPLSSRLVLTDVHSGHSPSECLVTRHWRPVA